MYSNTAQVLITDDDFHAIVDICAIIFWVVALLSNFGRVLKIKRAGRPSFDDYTAFLALILCAAQTVAILIAGRNGLGRHWSALNDAEQIVYQQALYAASLLFIPAIIISKLSLISSIRDLMPFATFANPSLVFGAGVLIWGVVSEVAAVFQSKPPDVWRSDGNIGLDKLSLWNSFTILSILTDIALILWPSIVINSLQTPLSQRVTAISYFSWRFFAIGALIAQLLFMNRAAGTSDPSFDIWPSVLCIQAAQALDLVATNIIYLRRFANSLRSDMLRSDNLRPFGSMDTDKYGTSRSSKVKLNTAGQVPENQAIPPGVNTVASFQLGSFRDPPNAIRDKELRLEDSQSISSQTGLVKHNSSNTRYVPNGSKASNEELRWTAPFKREAQEGGACA